MTVREIAEKLGLSPVSGSGGLDREVSCVFTCDLLSLAMGRAPERCAWITVMGNINVIAVASLAEVSFVVIAEGMSADGDAYEKADIHGLPLFESPTPVFETALSIQNTINGI